MSKEAKDVNEHGLHHEETINLHTNKGKKQIKKPKEKNWNEDSKNEINCGCHTHVVYI